MFSQPDCINLCTSVPLSPYVYVMGYQRASMGIPEVQRGWWGVNLLRVKQARLEW